MKAKFTHAELLERFSYNPESGLFTCLSDGAVKGRLDHKGYVILSIRKDGYRAHRLAWLYMTGEWPAEEIDHINGDRADNRFANLRACSHPQNNHNQPMRSNNTSGVKGVHWNRRKGKWHVQVCLNYKIHHGGLFASIGDAEVAARALRHSLHGEFANHG